MAMMARAAVLNTRQQILDTARPIIASKGFSAVGLSEILLAARVPKGSFYHWFSSKEHFGEALLEHYFEAYLHQVDTSLGAVGLSAPDRLTAFFVQWHRSQSSHDPELRCLVVKLSAEVCDLSEPMREALQRGIAQVLDRIQICLEVGVDAGELSDQLDPYEAAHRLYQQWIGATLLSLIQRSPTPLDQALAQTHHWIESQGVVP